ncbi:hypothetical protein [Nonomuraea cavernae]|uniref:hypothetical protein n=1 Tax=Nonomuraea cavernae TaxID=2045107 RepID=UPI0033C43A19
MIGGRMIMESPVFDTELTALKRRVSDLEEEVRTLTAANLALVRAVENIRALGNVRALENAGSLKNTGPLENARGDLAPTI